MSPVYCPGNPYPTVWERLLKMMGRKNRLGSKPQKERGRTKGGRKPARPPHRGGKSGGLFGGGGLFDDNDYGPKSGGASGGRNGRPKGGGGFW